MEKKKRRERKKNERRPQLRVSYPLRSSPNLKLERGNDHFNAYNDMDEREHDPQSQLNAQVVYDRSIFFK